MLYDEGHGCSITWFNLACAIMSYMSKVADYLNQHLVGDVISDVQSREIYSTDGSVLRVTPHLIVNPRVTDDVRKIARFAWRLSERGQVLSLTPRGSGLDPTGAAIGSGILLSFIPHMNHIMELDVKGELVRVQPGISYVSLSEAMATHGLAMPVATGNSRAETIGGMLGSNAIGDGFVKYGLMRDWVDRLEVVLANGEIIQTGRINKKELSAKKGLETLEGEIYRSIDSLIEDNQEVIGKLDEKSSFNASGYAIDQVKRRDGSFDLSPLIIGSQGTLGIVTQAILKLTKVSNQKSVIVAALTEEQNLSDLTNRLIELEPSAISFIDGDSLKLIKEISGYDPWSSVTKDLPKILLFIEFDDKHQSKKLRKAGKILDSAAVADANIATTPEDIELMQSLRDSTDVITNYSDDNSSSLPLATDLSVPPEDMYGFLDKLREIIAKNHVKAGVWGNPAAGLVSVRASLNLASLGHRQILFRLLDEFRELTSQFDGSLTGNRGEGRLLAPFARKQYDKKLADVYSQIKKTFDPLNVLNKGVKTTEDKDELLTNLRRDYRGGRLTEYNLPG